MVLGPLEIRADADVVLPVRRGRPRALVHLLLMHRRVVVPVDVIADRLWDQDLPHDAANGVHQLVSYLRRALGAEGKGRLITTAVGYRLDVADDEVDAWRFDRLLQEALAGLLPGSAAAAQRALTTAEEAARLWRGEPYPESSAYGWASGDINRLKESYLQLQEARLEAMIQLGRHREVVLEAQSLVAAHPLREQFHAQQALALYRSDRQSEALDVLRRVRQMLADELGLDPGAAVDALEQQILRRDPRLAWKPPDGTATPASTASPAATEDGEGLKQAFPVPGLPPRPPRLIGRDDDLADLTRRLRPGTTVTLTGPAGIGKTALARTVARTIVEGPVWYVDLADVDAAELAAAAMARQLGHGGQLPNDPTSVLVAAFRPLRGLLVVDTCEHLVPTVSLILNSLQEQCAELTILATSRRPLDLPDEVVYRLPPLLVPPEGARLALDALSRVPAVELFVERAARVRNDFALDPATADDVAEIVRAMEGLPLGLELAAAAAEVLDAAGIRDRLDNRLGTGVRPAAFVPRRQASLTAALDASCVLLTAAEKEVLASLAVFRSTFDLDAVTAVVAPEVGDPFPTLASLVRQSMVSHEGGQRYRLLRPMRDHVLEAVATGPGVAEMRDRHVAYVAATSRAASRELRTGTTALSRLHRLLPDARAAMEWSLVNGRLPDAADIAVAYTWYWAINGWAEEGTRWLSIVAAELDRDRDRHPPDRRQEAAVLRSLGLLANPMGDVGAARNYCRRSLELSRSVGDDIGTTAALLTLGIAEWARGDFAAAATAHDEALAIAARTGEPWHRLAALTLRARTALDAGEEDAVERIERAIAAGQREDERQMLSIAMSLLARHHLGTGQTAEAAIAVEGALDQARRIGYREGEVGALNLLGRVRLEQGRVDAADDCFVTALTMAVEIQHRGAVCESVESLALSAAASGRREDAYRLLLASARERERLGLRAPAFGAEAVSRAERSTAEILGSATALVHERVTLVKFDELVAELLPQAQGTNRSAVS
ncbi:AfsR/SARP family transcriptional regulator [Blastococcus sp. SYSU D00669]